MVYLNVGFSRFQLVAKTLLFFGLTTSSKFTVDRRTAEPQQYPILSIAV